MEFNPVVHEANEHGDPIRNEDGKIRLKKNWRDLATDERSRKYNPRVHGEEPKLNERGFLAIRPRDEVPIIGQTQRVTAFVEGLKEPGYTYYVCNDEPGRIGQFLAAGWEQVADHDGKIARMHVGLARDGGTEGVLLRKPEEWYAEDQRAKREKTVVNLANISNPSKNGQYVPGGHESALREDKDPSSSLA